MRTPAKKVLDDALALPADERRALAEALVESLTEPTDDIERAWRDEAMRRAEEVTQGRGHLLDLEATVAELREALRVDRST